MSQSVSQLMLALGLALMLRRAFLLRLTIAASLMLFAAHFFSTHYRIGVQAADVACLPYKVWIYALQPSQPARDSYLAYHARGMQPFLPDGSVVAKQVVGVPGDHVVVDGQALYVNGQLKARLNPAVIKALGRAPADFKRDVVLAGDELVLVGTLPRSFDARYLGPIHTDQVIGEAYPLW